MFCQGLLISIQNLKCVYGHICNSVSIQVKSLFCIARWTTRMRSNATPVLPATIVCYRAKVRSAHRAIIARQGRVWIGRPVLGELIVMWLDSMKKASASHAPQANIVMGSICHHLQVWNLKVVCVPTKFYNSVKKASASRAPQANIVMGSIYYHLQVWNLKVVCVPTKFYISVI